MKEASKHIKGCRECQGRKKNNGKLCKIATVQYQQSLLCFFRSTINVPFDERYFKYYRNMLQNLGKSYSELKCPKKSLLCYSKVVEIDNKLIDN